MSGTSFCYVAGVEGTQLDMAAQLTLALELAQADKAAPTFSASYLEGIPFGQVASDGLFGEDRVTLQHMNRDFTASFH